MPTTTSSSSKIKTPVMTAREAAILALDYFREIRSLTNLTDTSTAVEEIEYIRGASFWNITIGCALIISLSAASADQLEWQRYVITVDAKKQKIISMRLRELLQHSTEFARPYALRNISISELADQLVRSMKQEGGYPIDPAIETMTGILPKDTDIDASRMEYLTNKHLNGDNHD
jgi:hypothetical protein